MNKTVNIKNFIMVVDNVLSSEKCNDILAVLEEKTKDFDSISNFENSRDRLDKQWDGGTVLQSMGRKLSFDYASFFSQVLKENLELYVNTYLTNCAVFFDKGQINYSVFKFQVTPISGGFHNWHSENNAGPFETKCRFLAWSLFLNDVEEGGELEFLNYSTRIKAKKGSLVLFPAYFTHAHRGNPPISNTKYIATGWYRHFLFDD